MAKCVCFETVFVARCASLYLDRLNIINMISDGIDRSAIASCVLVQDSDLSVLLAWADRKKVGYSVQN